MILLNADESKYGKSKKDEGIGDFLDITVRTIENVRKRFIEDGFEAALSGKPKEREYKYKVDGDTEAHMIEIFLPVLYLQTDSLIIATSKIKSEEFNLPFEIKRYCLI